MDNDGKILKALSDIHLKGKWFDLDCTYSKGNFYTETKQPTLKSDIKPEFQNVIKADSRKLDFVKDNSLESIVFDPPFLFRKRKSENKDKMSKRFSYFDTYDELKEMYSDSLKCFSKKLKRNGYVFFKCQDMTDGRFYCTHFAVIQMARENGFELKDIAIKVTKNKLQKDAKQQNCVAKIHSYWLVFKKKGNIEKTAFIRCKDCQYSSVVDGEMFCSITYSTYYGHALDVEAEIHIGDEVTKDGNNYVVFGFYGGDNNTLDLVTKHGVMVSLHKSFVKKTGKHYPIEEMLKELE